MSICTSKATDARSLARLGSVCALLVAAPLGGCAGPHVLPPPATPYDYRDRHPVVLTEAPQVMDLLPSSVNGQLDGPTVGRIREFVTRYREFGHGRITLLVPVGSESAKFAASQAPAVRRALAAAGVNGNITVGDYQVTDPRLAAPLRLSFEALKAKVANRCGEWPRDLASGASLAGWQNESYWNFGCAEQSTFAAQIADPRDLLGPRGKTSSDIEMRMRAIERLRTGQDPSTTWIIKNTSISSVGGD